MSREEIVLYFPYHTTFYITELQPNINKDLINVKDKPNYLIVKHRPFS